MCYTNPTLKIAKKSKANIKANILDSIQKDKKIMKLKYSFYNLEFQHKNNCYVFNSLRCSLTRIDNVHKDILNKVKNSEPSIEKEENSLDELIRGGFILEESFDELEFLEFLNWQGKFQSNNLTLTLFPIFSCNCKCTYCYQKPKVLPSQTMQKETIDYIVKMA